MASIMAQYSLQTRVPDFPCFVFFSESLYTVNIALGIIGKIPNAMVRSVLMGMQKCTNIEMFQKIQLPILMEILQR